MLGGYSCAGLEAAQKHNPWEPSRERGKGVEAMDAMQEVTRSGNVPDNVGAGAQVAVEHGQAGVADEIGETHFGDLWKRSWSRRVSNTDGCW